MPLDPFLAAKLHLIDGVSWEDTQRDPVLAARAAEYHTDPAEPVVPDVAIADPAAIRLRDQREHSPDKLLLAYPFAHFPVPALDDETAAEMLPLSPMLRFTTEGIEGMVRNYVGRITDLPPEALPGAAKLT